MVVIVSEMTMTRGSALGAIALTWIVAALFTLVVAAETHIGPVVLTLTRRHGVHLGDVCAMVAAGGAAVMITAWVLSRRLRA